MIRNYGAVHMRSYGRTVHLTPDRDIHQVLDILLTETVWQMMIERTVSVVSNLFHHIQRINNNGRVSQTGATAQDCSVKQLLTSLIMD